MPSLTRDIFNEFNQLSKQSIYPITTILDPALNKANQAYQKYPSGWKMKKKSSPNIPNGLNRGGIYVFWWIKRDSNSLIQLKNQLPVQYNLKGKKIKGVNGHHQVTIDITAQWLDLYSNDIPLYVGKNDDCIFDRIGLHLQIHKDKYYGNTSSDQLRRGIERIFHNSTNTSNIIVNHIGFSYWNLHGSNEAVNRFYLEDYAIGKLKPLFNVDIER